MSAIIERRVCNGEEMNISLEDRAHPMRLLPPDMPAEFRALAMANIRGDKDLAQAAHELISAAEEIRETPEEDFRVNATRRLRASAAELFT